MEQVKSSFKLLNRYRPRAMNGLFTVPRNCDEAVGAGGEDVQGPQVAERCPLRHGVGGSAQVPRARLREEPGKTRAMLQYSTTQHALK